MELKDIKQDKHNYRVHNERNLSLIKKSIDEVGFGRSIVIDNQNEIIAGNGLISQVDKNTKIKVIETDGSELVVVKRTDLKTNDDKRRQLAIMDNSTSDNSTFDFALLQSDFDNETLSEFGIDMPNLDTQIVDEEELMDNDNLQEMNTSKALALSKMPIDTYLVIKFDENMSKADFIERYAKQMNPESDIDVKTQFCTWAFMKKDPDND